MKRRILVVEDEESLLKLETTPAVVDAIRQLIT